METDRDNLLAKGAFIADCLYTYCVLPDSGERLKRTGAICPSTTLKSSIGRKAFQWATQVQGRKKFFTTAACRKGVEMLLLKPDVVVPLVGLPHDLWVLSQTKVVKRLAQRARRNLGGSLRFLTYQQSKSMDWEETLPVEERICGHILVSNPH